MFAAARSAHLYKVAGDRSYPEEVVKCSLASIVVATGAVPPRVSSLALRLHSAAHSTETVSRPTSIISLSVYTAVHAHRPVCRRRRRSPLADIASRKQWPPPSIPLEFTCRAAGCPHRQSICFLLARLVHGKQSRYLLALCQSPPN